MPENPNPDSLQAASELGLSVLSQIIERAADGVFLCDDQRRWVYANEAACQMLGRTEQDMIGRDYVDAVPAAEKAAARRYYSALLAGSTEMLTRMLIGADGQEREVVFAPMTLDIDGRPHGAAFFHDFTETRAAARTAAALGQSAARLVGTESTNEILGGIARQAVEGTRAQWCAVAVINDTDTAILGSGYGPEGVDHGTGGPWRAIHAIPVEDMMSAITAGAIVPGEAPGRAVVIPDALKAWHSDPITRNFADAAHADGWNTAVCLPLVWKNQVIGMIVAGLTDSIRTPSEAELAFCAALADQAAVAVTNERLSRQATRRAALQERSRVARELHDSVSQALFAMTMHARTAELAMRRAGLDLDTALGRSVTQLSELSRGSLAEMRALIFELRPEALADEGLLGALRTQAAALTAREHVAVSVHGPDIAPVLNADVETQLYKIIFEALQNVVKHAHADLATVTLRVDGNTLRVTVADDGVGFHPGSTSLNRSGLPMMKQRANAIGAELFVTSSSGTTISLRMAINAHAPVGGRP